MTFKYNGFGSLRILSLDCLKNPLSSFISLASFSVISVQKNENHQLLSIILNTLVFFSLKDSVVTPSWLVLFLNFYLWTFPNVHKKFSEPLCCRHQHFSILVSSSPYCFLFCWEFMAYPRHYFIPKWHVSKTTHFLT